VVLRGEGGKAMSDGLWAVIGAGVGVLGSVATTYLNARLAQPKPDPVAEARKKLLLSMLSEQRWKWRDLDVLSHTVGADEQSTMNLLLEIGAQGSEDGQDLWGLVSRVRGEPPPARKPKGR
jgi:hypothetical protein